MRWRAGQRRAARQAERQQANADRLFREADHWADVAEAAPNYRREITAERAGRVTREELSTPYGMGYTEDRHMGWDEYFGGELDAAKASDGPVLSGGALDAEISRLALAFPDPGDFAPGADADAATVAAWEERAWAEGERDRARDRAELEERRAAEVDDPADSHRYRPAPRVTAREITTDASEHRVTWDQYPHTGLGGEQDADARRQQRERDRAAGQGPADGSHPGGLFADAIAASDRRAAQQDREAARWVRGGREQQELRDARRAGAETADQVVRAQLDAGMKPEAVDRSAEQVLGGRFENPTPVSDAFYGGYDDVAATYVADARRDIEAG